MFEVVEIIAKLLASTGTFLIGFSALIKVIQKKKPSAKSRKQKQT